LGFGELGDSSEVNELARLYLEAHEEWKTVGREVVKFFVWRPGNAKTSDVPQLYLDFSTGIDIWLVPQGVHEHIVNAIETAMRPIKPFPNLASVQFFLWNSNGGGSPTPASLPRRKGLKEEKIIGFFAPYRAPDLVAGVLWLKQPNDRIRLILSAYSEILLALRSQANLLQKVTATSKSPHDAKMLPATKTVITKVVNDCLKVVLPQLRILSTNGKAPA
jgi:hypothetical protein